MSVHVTYYADTLEDVRDALVQHLRRRADVLENAGHNKTEKAKNHRASFELSQEAAWLALATFEPRANALLYKETNDG